VHPSPGASPVLPHQTPLGVGMPGPFGAPLATPPGAQPVRSQLSTSFGGERVDTRPALANIPRVLPLPPSAPPCG
jgi:hypothetical protein